MSTKLLWVRLDESWRHRWHIITGQDTYACGPWRTPLVRKEDEGETLECGPDERPALACCAQCLAARREIADRQRLAAWNIAAKAAS